MSRHLNISILKNPLFVMGVIIAGIYIGLYFPEFAISLKPIGTVYLKLLQMSVIPILVTAVISSIGRISDTEHIKEFIFKYVLIYLLSCVVISSVGVFGGILGGKVGLKVSEENKERLGVFIQESADKDLEVSLNQPFHEKDSGGIENFLLETIPDNIFQALVSGATLQLVFFSLIIGICLNLLDKQKKKPLIDMCVSVFLAFQRFIDILIYFLPLGIICLVSSQIAETGLGLIENMLNFIVLFYALSLSIIAVSIFIIYYCAKKPFIETFRNIINPIMIAFTTRSSFASIPVAVEALEKLKFERVSVNLVIPLGISLGRYGNILFFAAAAVFTFYLYGTPTSELSAQQILLILVGAIIAGLASTGATGFATLGMLSIILKPLELPLEAVVLIFTAIDIIIDPIRSLIIVIVNLVVTSVVSRKYEGERKNSPV